MRARARHLLRLLTVLFEISLILGITSCVSVTKHFADCGTETTSLFRLDTGLAVFTMTHDGSSVFIVELMDVPGKEWHLLAAEIGAFNGSNAVHVEHSGSFLLSIDADGCWTVNVEQPGRTPGCSRGDP